MGGTAPDSGADQVGDRLRLARGDRPLNAVADMLGVHRNTLRRYEHGEASPDAELLSRVCQRLSVNEAWLLSGRGPKNRDSALHEDGAAPHRVPAAAIHDLGGDDFVLVPRYDVRAAAGAGSVAPSEDVLEYLAFRRDWLAEIGVLPHKARLLEAVGDSMEPTISHGNILLIDTGIDRVVDNAIYVIVLNGIVMLKRVQQMLDGSVLVKSDNPAYEPERLAPDDAAHLVVAGRVRWYGRTL